MIFFTLIIYSLCRLAIMYAQMNKSQFVAESFPYCFLNLNKFKFIAESEICIVGISTLA